jgi:hypothetical protein
MNWFVREKDDYMFLYESYYLFSYIIDISVDFEPHFYKIIINRTQGCVTSMLTSLEWQTLEQRRKISRFVMMYKIQHQLLDIDRDLYLRPGDSRTLVFCWCNHLWRSGQLFFVHFLMSVSGFRWWDHKPLLLCKNVVQSPPKYQWYKKTNNSFHKETYNHPFHAQINS